MIPFSTLISINIVHLKLCKSTDKKNPEISILPQLELFNLSTLKCSTDPTLFHFPALHTGGHSFMLQRLVRAGFGKLLQLDFLIFLSRVLEILWRHKIFLLCFPLPQVLEQEFHSAGTHLKC